VLCYVYVAVRHRGLGRRGGGGAAGRRGGARSPRRKGRDWLFADLARMCCTGASPRPPRGTLAARGATLSAPSCTTCSMCAICPRRTKEWRLLRDLFVLRVF